MNDFTIDSTPNCPRCHVPLSLFADDLPCGILWYCDQHAAETGLDSIFLTLADVDAVLRDPAAWDAVVAEHQTIQERWEP